MSHRNQPNIRTKFKNLLKNLSRGEITENDVQNELRHYGILGTSASIRVILKTKISARIIYRIGKAAKKKEMFVPLTAFQFPIFFKDGPHTIKFVKIITKEIKETWEFVESRAGFETPYKLLKKEITNYD